MLLDISFSQIDGDCATKQTEPGRFKWKLNNQTGS